MVAAVARHGYAGTTLRELVTIAGVSKSTFYEHFESKQDCFLATFDDVIGAVSERVGAAYQTGGDSREKLRAALAEVMDIAVTEPEITILITVESLTLGSIGFAHMEKGAVAFEALIGQSFAESRSRKAVSPTIVRAITAGIRGVIYRHIREGRAKELPGAVDELVDWAFAHQAADSDAVRAAIRAVRSESGPGPVAGEGIALDWREPPDSARSRAELTQRERIVRAISQLVVEKGYETLSIPAISARAGTSNQTFYENFDNKREAFMAAFDATSEAALLTVRNAYSSAGGGPRGIGAAIRAGLEQIASNELLARLTFFELQSAGPVALDRADAVMDSVTGFLDVSAEDEARYIEVSANIAHAVGSGCWSVIQHGLMEGEAAALPELGPTLARILLTPAGQAVASRSD